MPWVRWMQLSGKDTKWHYTGPSLRVMRASCGRRLPNVLEERTMGKVPLRDSACKRCYDKGGFSVD